MPLLEPNSASLRPYLEQCGYTKPRLAENYRFNGATVPLVGFYCQPFDVRSACLAVVDGNGDGREAANTCIGLGAPTALVCCGDLLEWWRLAASGPSEVRRVKTQDIDGFFREHKDNLAPEAIYSAKLRRPTLSAQQMWFVDVGLMPATERRTGATLHRWVEGAIQDLTTILGGRLRSKQNFADLYKTVFWLLAAKLLHEKGVENFKRIDLTDVDDVFRRVGRHYADVEDLPPGGQAWRPAIAAAAQTVAAWGHLGNLSAESLAYLYETALIDARPKGKRGKSAAASQDIRKELGIHSTPPPLIDHMLAQLWPLVEQQEPAERRVFEPACGHAGFLVAAMRWLRDHSRIDDGVMRHRYLRDRLYGVEVDDFARELAKLQLTLADVPHGNSWRIDDSDMFLPDVLSNAASSCTLLLANPPYEAFTPAQRREYQRRGAPVTAITKAAEMLKRSLPSLPVGGVFGVVVPQGVLHDRESQSIREFLLKECALEEVAVFADNLFEKGDHEIAVLMGKRRGPTTQPGMVTYRRVRERGMSAFRERTSFSWERVVRQSRFATDGDGNLMLPDLPEVWDFLHDASPLEIVADIQQGFQFLSKERLEGREVIFASKRAGLVRALLRAADDYTISRPPKAIWIDPAPRNFRRPGAATKLGVPQVVLNYAPIDREPWRLKAIIDKEGLAVSSRFLVFRPKPGGSSLQVLWAVLNSPIANAFAFSFSGKRQTLVKEWRAFPMPTLTAEHTRAIEAAAAKYLHAVQAAEEAFMKATDEDEIRRALLAMDAEVLRLYDLPPRLERQLLDLFTNVERKGAGCEFRGYYPPDVDAFVPLHELISEEYARSTLGRFRAQHVPLDSPSLLEAFRTAATAFAEE